MQIKALKSVITVTGYVSLVTVLFFCSVVALKAGSDWMLYPIVIGMFLSYSGLIFRALLGKGALKSYARSDLVESFVAFEWGSLFSTGFLSLYYIFLYLYKKG